MRIAILGAGGVGGYYGGVLARAGHEVGLLARGEHLAALGERGLEVRMPEETFTTAVAATDDPGALAGAELAVVAVKSYSLPEIAPATRLLAEAGAAVLPLLNGVEVAGRLVAAGVPDGRVLGGLTEISAARVAPGVVERRSPYQRVVVGERSGEVSARAERIAAAFQAAGVEARAAADIEADLWRKWIFIASMAAACGLSRSAIGAMQTKPSFLLDLEAGGPTEIDDLSGAVSRLGGAAGVDTPVHDVATLLLGGTQPPG